MKLVPLSQVSSQLREGAALPWNVRDEEGKLLLARGHLVESAELSNRLLERGMFVDMDAVRSRAGESDAEAAPPPEKLFDRLRILERNLATLLKDPYQSGFAKKITDISTNITEMASRNGDPVIFDVMQPRANELSSYGISHSLHAAAVCALITDKLDWPQERVASLVKAALTMNASICELQGHLAIRRSRPTSEQKDAIEAHPLESANLLRKAGADDPLWLQIVEQHHEQPGGKGYPKRIQEPHELAQMLHLVDVFLAKHSGRANRTPLPAKQAAQELYAQTTEHFVAGLLIKEFGMFPPGCYVQLASGEIGIVLRRGSNAGAPIVSVLINRKGEPLGTPARRDTAEAEFKIVKTLPAGPIKVNFFAEALYDRLELE
jgi:HD-GYP domain-containing protein (c-di-GMP phosphodiesterase class II)